MGWTRDSAETMAVAAALTVSMLLLLRLPMMEMVFPVTGVRGLMVVEWFYGEMQSWRERERERVESMYE